jgi:hypothetical protein
MAIEYQGEYRLGAGAWQSLFSWQTGLSFPWNTSALANGNYEVRVQARDTGSSVGTGATLLWSGYFPGNNEGMGRAVTVLPNGDAIIAGATKATNFPVTSGGGTYGGTSDAFVMRVTPAGTILWCRYLGGANYERVYGIDCNASGEVVICGRAGAGFPVTPGVFQPTFMGGSGGGGTYGAQDGFVAKINTSTGALIWASYFGTDDFLIVRGCAIDDAGNV